MDELLQIGLSNAVVAVLLAVPAALAGRYCRRPALVHALWLLVLLKLVTPPLLRLLSERFYGVWRSLVAHYFGVVGVVGSNPAAPI